MASISIRGARTHNLRGVDVDVPLGQLTVLTGVSGSGKSSLAFDTVHAEGRRRYLEALDAREGTLRRPAVDALTGLPPTVALRQHERAPSLLDTVGTVTEAWAVLGVIASRAGVQHDPETGEAIRPTPHDRILADLLAAPEGTRLTLEAPLLPGPDATLHGLLDEVRRAGFSRVRLHGRIVRADEIEVRGAPDPDLRVVVDRLKVARDRRPRLAEALRTAGAAGHGVIVAVLGDEERVYVDRPFSLRSRRTFPALSPALFSFAGLGRCPTCEGTGTVDGPICADCGGTRLREASRHVRWRDVPVVDLHTWSAERLLAWLDPDACGPDVIAAVKDLSGRLQTLCTLGLGHLSLDRRAPTLSSGEWQRVRLARLVASDLSGVLYVLDEPTAGLGDGAVAPVLGVMDELIERGNTLLVVSHREAMVRRAHQVVELGPGAGEAGGTVLFAGTPPDLCRQDTPSGRWLAGRRPALEIEEPVGTATLVSISGLPEALGVPTVSVPVGRVTAITGPPGAGSSRLLRALEARVAGGAVPSLERVLAVDDARTSSARSLVATFVGTWQVLRELLAATTEATVRGLSASSFSLNTPGGRCEACKGQGEIRVDLGLLPPVWVACEICDGRRFQEDLLDITWKGRSPAELLDLTAQQAHVLLAGHPKLDRQLRALVDVGLGYVPLGQPTPTLSGGEAARLRLAKELGRSRAGVEGALILVDGPTDGLHPDDADAQILLLHRLAASGGTVVVASHDPKVLATAHLRVRLGDPADRTDS